jgi:hypothetical protein
VTSATPAGSVPTFTISGCAASQHVVADTMQRLRLIDGVSEVTLQSSTSGASTGNTSAGSGCGSGPVFQMTVTFDALPSAAAASAAAGGSKASTVADAGTAGSASAPSPTTEGGSAG